MLNKVMIIGNLGADPVVKTTSGNSKIVNLNIATTESWKDKDGQPQKRTEWHRVVIFNDGIAGVAEKYLKKGSKVYIEGAIQSRKWTDNNNQERTVTEIVISKFKGALVMLSGSDETTKYPLENTESSRAIAHAKVSPINEDDPFASDDELPMWS